MRSFVSPFCFAAIFFFFCHFFNTLRVSTGESFDRCAFIEIKIELIVLFPKDCYFFISTFYTVNIRREVIKYSTACSTRPSCRIVKHDLKCLFNALLFASIIKILTFHYLHNNLRELWKCLSNNFFNARALWFPILKLNFNV